MCLLLLPLGKRTPSKKRHAQAHTHTHTYVHTHNAPRSRCIVDGMLQKIQQPHNSYIYITQFIVISIRLFNDFRFSCYLCIVLCFHAMLVSSASVYTVHISTGCNYIEMKVFTRVSRVYFFESLVSLDFFPPLLVVGANIDTYTKCIHREYGPIVCLFDVKCIAYALANGQKLN